MGYHTAFSVKSIPFAKAKECRRMHYGILTFHAFLCGRDSQNEPNLVSLYKHHPLDSVHFGENCNGWTDSFAGKGLFFCSVGCACSITCGYCICMLTSTCSFGFMTLFVQCIFAMQFVLLWLNAIFTPS